MFISIVILICFTNSLNAFDLQILHLNDLHAHFEPVDINTSLPCETDREDKCIGGIARIFSVVTKAKDVNDNCIFLNAGDSYLGSSLWNGHFQWNITSSFLNKIPTEAITIGNHEFDHGINGILPFLIRIKWPVIAANINCTNEPSLEKYIKKYVVIENCKKIGIIGYVLRTLNNTVDTGNLIFLDEATTVNTIAADLKQQGINIIIALSHAGLNVDRIVAAKAIEVDVIVGGHSHSFMYTGIPPSTDKLVAEYPEVVYHNNGHKVLIVQAGAYSRYLGNISITFDEQGEVTSWQGNPILLNQTVSTDIKKLFLLTS